MSLPQPVRLYDQPRAPNPRRVNIFLAEKGVEIERVNVDLMAGAPSAVGRDQLQELHLASPDGGA